MSDFRPTTAIVNLTAIKRNVEEIRRVAATEVACVVKADGYGHGAIETSRACIEAGATRLCVALVEEGVQLRDAGIDVPIIVLVEAPKGASEAIVERNLTASVYGLESAKWLAKAAANLGRQAPVHLCVDTGMHREGASPTDAPQIATEIRQMNSISLEGVWSHFAVADEPDNPIIAIQVEKFASVADLVEAPLRHLSNSAGALVVENSRLDFVRAGIATYGLYPNPSLKSAATLKPALTLKSAIGFTRRIDRAERVSYGLTWQATKDTNIATVQLGYADGFPRCLSNNADVLIGGKRRPVIGRVTMDTIIADLGQDTAQPGDEVVVIGRQNGESITTEELADRAQTINYEIVCGISKRVPRIYVS